MNAAQISPSESNFFERNPRDTENPAYFVDIVCCNHRL